MINKKKTLLVALLLLVAIGLNGCAKDAKEEGLVAKVNDEGITEEEYNMDLQIEKDLYKMESGGKELTEEDLENLKEKILTKLIIEKLIAQDASSKDIVVSKEEVKEELKGLSTPLGGEEKLDAFLQTNNIPKEYFTEQIKKGLLLIKHKDNFIKESDIDKKDAEKYYNENKDELVVIKARHILVDDEKKGKELLEKLKKGEDFGSLAKAESKDSVSAIKGGELGYFKKGSMIKEFDEAAFNLKVGEISPLVKTKFGYHIIEVEERKDTLEELNKDIINMLKDEDYEKYIQDLQSNAKIKKYLDLEKK
ncbi:peptidylprolyl isomerase [Wansuia hejianensis]|uniref:Peptidylprolyl isomerase n=1 Tax=Wansuia hejianensis TaxID=2763667 RepID=A0A926F3E4_9FIRM|nr:peptidylprolyl isomerase [Wansuia hejianensis]MBC8591235.1 peptidylprolyl isomerase [Wansuia hejianensis]